LEVALPDFVLALGAEPPGFVLASVVVLLGFVLEVQSGLAFAQEVGLPDLVAAEQHPENINYLIIVKCRPLQVKSVSFCIGDYLK
jgi:hypothetical protein